MGFRKFKFWTKSLIGIDQAILYTTFSRGIQSFGGMINLLLISLYLSSEEQGYYYTFGSLIAIQIFFELGLNSIIVQFVAHEVAHLNYNKNENTFVGEEYYVSRVSHILKLIKKAFLFLALIFFIVLFISGVIFFQRYGESNKIMWFYPWLLLCASTALFFFLNPFIAFFQGLGNIVEVSRLYFIQQIIVTPVILLCLVSKFGIWTLGISNLISVIAFAWFLNSGGRFDKLKYFFSNKTIFQVDYFKEIFPFQWKIAVSWISGYFIFQIFNPVLFVFEGAEVAGKMGITLVALNGVSAISMSWLSTKVQLFSTLVSRKNFKELDLVFSNTFKNQIIVTVVLLIAFNFILYLLGYYNFELANRFLELKYTMLLSIITAVNQIINLWATYLRCHKEEPFLINSIVGGILCLISTLTFGYHFGVRGIIYGYLGLTVLVGLPWANYVYYSKKVEWHK